MDRRFSAPYFITLAAVPVAAILRLWSLLRAVDDQGLPVLGLPTGLLIGAAVVFLLAALACALRSPGRSGRYRVLQYGQAGFACGVISGVLIGLGAVLEFAEALRAGPGISAPILALLGLLAGVCLCLAARARRQEGAAHPGVEVLPLLYLLLKLIFNFKSWSTDPIILDYCFVLFALIFALLAFYRGAGFVFDQGKARSTLFCCMGAVFFCAAAVLDGIVDLSPSEGLLYGGFLLWQLPVIWDLLVPSDPDPKPEPEKKKRRARE